MLTTNLKGIMLDSFRASRFAQFIYSHIVFHLITTPDPTFATTDKLGRRHAGITRPGRLSKALDWLFIG